MLWFDHGKSPDSASYQYIVVPAVSEQELIETSRNNRGIRIIANTSEVQAVRNDKLSIVQIIFHKAGEIKISDGFKVRMDSPGMVMLKMQGDKVQELTVSDPSRKLSRIIVTLPGKYNNKGDHFITLPTTDQNNTMIIVDLPQDVYAGKSVTLRLN
jgi:chondroitin AC lyase